MKRWRTLDITKLLRNMERFEKQKFTCELFDYLHLQRPWTWKKKKEKVQVPQRNEMLRLYCTGLGFISKMKTIIANKIYLTVGIWKTWYYRKLLSNRKESKCDDYSLLFSMCTDDDEHILTCGGLTAFRYWSREKEPLFVTIVITYSDKILFNKRNKAIRFN